MNRTFEPTLSPPLFTLFSDLVEERTGIHYSPSDAELFTSKLAGRAIEAGFESALDYYYFLRYDDADRREFDALAESLVVHETYFFRELAPLVVLCDEILLPAIARGHRPRVWCTAAATGEEPLTLAMLLDERGTLGKVSILASDLSARAMARAAEGVYGPRAFRATSDAARARWFEPQGERMVVRRALRDAITWRRANLLDRALIGSLGTFDAILCRNVLIYFGDETVKRVAATLASALEPSGTLLVGVSESLLRFGTVLACEEHAGSFFYRKASA